MASGSSVSVCIARCTSADLEPLTLRECPDDVAVAGDLVCRLASADIWRELLILRLARTAEPG